MGLLTPTRISGSLLLESQVGIRHEHLRGAAHFGGHQPRCQRLEHPMGLLLPKILRRLTPEAVCRLRSLGPSPTDHPDFDVPVGYSAETVSDDPGRAGSQDDRIDEAVCP